MLWLVQAVQDYNADPDVHGILVQLPLPKHINEQTILDAVSYAKDVDGFHPQNIGCLAMRTRDPLFICCTPKVCIGAALHACVSLLLLHLRQPSSASPAAYLHVCMRYQKFFDTVCSMSQQHLCKWSPSQVPKKHHVSCELSHKCVAWTCTVWMNGQCACLTHACNTTGMHRAAGEIWRIHQWQICLCGGAQQHRGYTSRHAFAAPRCHCHSGALPHTQWPGNLQ